MIAPKLRRTVNVFVSTALSLAEMSEEFGRNLTVEDKPTTGNYESKGILNSTSPVPSSQALHAHSNLPRQLNFVYRDDRNEPNLDRNCLFDFVSVSLIDVVRLVPCSPTRRDDC